MTKSIKAALQRKNQNREESTFWARMRQTVYGSLGLMYHDDAQRERALEFFLPEWEERDRRVFSKLEDCTDSEWTVESIAQHCKPLVALSNTTATVSRVADDTLLGFHSALGLVVSLAAYGLAKRVPPFKHHFRDRPSYHVEFGDLRTMIPVLRAGFTSSEELAHIPKFFGPELSFRPRIVSELFDSVRLSGSHLMCEAIKSKVADTLRSTSGAMRPSDIARLIDTTNRATVTGALFLLTLEKPLEFARVESFRNEDEPPVLRCCYLTKNKHVEVGAMSTKEAKSFFASLSEASEAKPGSKADQNAEDLVRGLSDVLLNDIRLVIQQEVKNALNAAVVDNDRVQMQAIRELLKEKKLSTHDPVATLRAKLNKKKLPRCLVDER